MLAVEDLAVRYGPIAALRGVSIAVDEGEFVGIVGPNGAGKSTLLFSITGAVKAETGSVSFCGETLSGLAPEDIVRRGMALVPEGRELFGELTVEENLRLGATIRRDRRGVEEDVRAQMVSVFTIIDGAVITLFDGLRSPIRTWRCRLSYGRQRIKPLRGSSASLRPFE